VNNGDTIRIVADLNAMRAEFFVNGREVATGSLRGIVGHEIRFTLYN